MRLEQIKTEQAKLTQAQIDEKVGQTVANVESDATKSGTRFKIGRW